MIAHPNYPSVMAVVQELKMDHVEDASRLGQVRVKFPGSDIGMSIITQTMALNGMFCESCLIMTETKDLVYVPSLGYGDIRRFESADELKEHLINISTVLTNRTLAQIAPGNNHPD
jgi:hypothetical protein